MDRLVQGIFPTKRLIVAIPSRLVAIIPEFAPLSYPLAVLQNNPDAEITTDDQPDNIQRMALFRLAKMRRDIIEYRRVCISRDHQHQTQLHDAAPEFDAKWNEPTDVMDSQCLTGRTYENTRHELPREDDKTAEMKVHRRRNRPT